MRKMAYPLPSRGVFRSKAYIVNKVFTIMLFLCHLICDAAVLRTQKASPSHEQTSPRTKTSDMASMRTKAAAAASTLDLPAFFDDNRHGEQRKGAFNVMIISVAHTTFRFISPRRSQHPRQGTRSTTRGLSIGGRLSLAAPRGEVHWCQIQSISVHDQYKKVFGDDPTSIQ